MHDGMPSDAIQGQSQGHGASEFPKFPCFVLKLLESRYISLCLSVRLSQACDISLTEDVKGDERKFELWTQDHSQTYLLQVSDERLYNYCSKFIVIFIFIFFHLSSLCHNFV